jgi:hypothetical protein
MKPSRVDYLRHSYPLIDIGMSRKDCLEWMHKTGYPEPPRSACIFCPFHSDKEWRRLRDEEPKEWHKAIDFEKRMGIAQTQQEALRGQPFLHASCIPLDKVDLSEKVDPQLDLWGEECEGMCGV